MFAKKFLIILEAKQDICFRSERSFEAYCANVKIRESQRSHERTDKGPNLMRGFAPIIFSINSREKYSYQMKSNPSISQNLFFKYQDDFKKILGGPI